MGSKIVFQLRQTPICVDDFLTAVGRQVRGLSSISRVCVLLLGDLAVCTVFSFCCSDSLPLSVCSLSLRGIYDYRPGIKRFKEGSRSLALVYREGQWSSLEHTPVHGVHWLQRIGNLDLVVSSFETMLRALCLSFKQSSTTSSIIYLLWLCV